MIIDPAITALIGTVGFPIVGFFVMWQLVKEGRKEFEIYRIATTKVIEDNTRAIRELKETIIISVKDN